jgi:hypothetical protein
MFDWLSLGPPYPEVEGWKRVGGGRLEGPGYISTDFDLLLLEQVLQDHGIRCQFLPHRPGEGLGVGREGFTGVALYVPDDHYDKAAALAEELASAPLLEGDAGQGEDGLAEDADDEGGDGTERVADDALGDEENSS